MDVKLKVLGGAKSGLEIPLKKELFTIGRSSECSLRAGSDAISRKHCAIRLNGSKISIADLKSRNGTFVNGQKIEEETVLSSGDEVRVGPLKFQVVALQPEKVAERAEKKEVATAGAKSTGPPSGGAGVEDSIDEWLTAPATDSQVMHETRSLRLDETQGGQAPDVTSEQVEQKESPSTAGDDPAASEEPAQSEESQADEAEGAAEESAIRKRKDKKEPGKLPSRPKGPTTKDSREAASEVLRAMTRRR